MKCQEVLEVMHEFIDGRLPWPKADGCSRHLTDCPSCREVHGQLVWVREMVSTECRLSEAAEEQLWEHIQERRWGVEKVEHWLLAEWSAFCAFWRDLDRSILWSKVMATPVTFVFFVFLMIQLAPLTMQEASYPVVRLLKVPSSVFTRTVVTEMPVRQEQTHYDRLMNTAWKIPYEDSLALVAGITPEGSARIDNVLQYPKNQALLHEVDRALRQTQFETDPSLSKPFLIYSFQKIDVYSEQRGL